MTNENDGIMCNQSDEKKSDTATPNKNKSATKKILKISRSRIKPASHISNNNNNNESKDRLPNEILNIINDNTYLKTNKDVC